MRNITRIRDLERKIDLLAEHLGYSFDDKEEIKIYRKNISLIKKEKDNER